MDEEIQNSAQTTMEEQTEPQAVDVPVEGVAEPDNTNEMEFKDEDSTADDTSEKPKQSADVNAEYAKRRREAEAVKRAAQQQFENELERVRIETVIRATGGKNAFTGEDIKDAADVEEYLTMKEIEAAGKDPVADYSRFVKERNKERSFKQNESMDYRKDLESFVAKNPNVNVQELFDNPDFVNFTDGLVGKVSLDVLYKKFQGTQSLAQKQAQQKANEIIKRNASSPGSMYGGNGAKPKSYKDMSDDEFEKEVLKVTQKSY